MCVKMSIRSNPTDPIIDHLRVGLTLPAGRAFNADQVLDIFYQVCKSVCVLHSQEPPVIHRDLKVNNNKQIHYITTINIEFQS